MRACPDLNYVASIQGLVSVISRYYYANMSIKDIITNITFRDLIRRDTIFQSKKNMRKGVNMKKNICRESSMLWAGLIGIIRIPKTLIEL